MNKQPSSRTCFLCGRQNDIGLKMSWYNDLEAQQVKAEVVIPEHFNSYPGFVHGGIVAALLDETSGRALLLNGDNDKLMVTSKLEIKYYNPAPTGQPLTVTGWVTRPGDKYARVEGEIRLADNTLIARCKATVMRPPTEYYELWQWDKEEEFWKVYDD
ncbi:MAG: PaaI family thioesterase [Syntrophomonadaceae bacterium]|nr:PaaI family thioesterase [Syntrophomonadaceae bacterium]MDD4548556.1 PaaI family thioesterase [Syntrophomonadaceae bacterium]